MTIEPHQAVTVHLPVPMPPKPLASTYRDKLIARFGRIPSMAELAKMESLPRPYRSMDYAPLTPQGLAVIQDARRKVAEATDAQILAAIAETGSTSQDVATAAGRAENVTRRALLRLHSAGHVTCAKFKRATIWKRVVV